MYHLPLTLETPAENLALDEALLAAAEAGELAGETLRLWESPVPLVVLGRSSTLAEVQLDRCRLEGVPVLRRSSGGATVLVGPGCLMYAAVLDLTRRPELRAIDRAHREALARLADAVRHAAPSVDRAGVSDLVVAPSADCADARPRKVSGNSLRIKRNWLLYHGTVLYDFPLDSFARWLGQPTRMPAYRAERSHAEFLSNVPVSRAALECAVAHSWQAREPLPAWPRARAVALAREISARSEN